MTAGDHGQQEACDGEGAGRRHRESGDADGARRARQHRGGDEDEQELVDCGDDVDYADRLWRPRLRAERQAEGPRDGPNRHDGEIDHNGRAQPPRRGAAEDNRGPADLKGGDEDKEDPEARRLAKVIDGRSRVNDSRADRQRRGQPDGVRREPVVAAPPRGDARLDQHPLQPSSKPPGTVGDREVNRPA